MLAWSGKPLMPHPNAPHMVWLVDELVNALELFYQVATVDPLSFILVAGGSILLGITILVTTTLVGGAIADLVR